MGGKKFLEVVFKNSTQSPILGREQLFMSLQMTSIFGSTNFVTILVGWINLVGKNLHPVLHNTTRGILTVNEQIKKIERMCSNCGISRSTGLYIMQLG